MSWFEATDAALFRFLNQKLSCPILDSVIPYFSGFPGFMPLVILLAAMLLWKGGRRERMFVVVLAIVLSLGEGLLIAPMKEMVGRLRPFNVIEGTHLLSGIGQSGSMPSSHTSNWFAVMMVTLFFYPRSYRFTLPIACLVGYSRIYVGVHYPGDVLAGAILGAGYAAAGVIGLNAAWRALGQEFFPLWLEEMPSLIIREGGASVPASRTSENSSKKQLTGLPQGLSDLQWARLGYGLILVVLSVQLVYIASRKIELSGDEAYQWVWSKHLALSYYSKPPMIAYVQFLGTSLFGDNTLGVRFFSPVIAALICWLLLRFFAREVSGRAGFWLVVIFQCTPMLGVGSTLMTVDPPLCLFWVAAMVAGWRAIQLDSTVKNWAWVGLWLGLGFLSKYAALFQILCWAVFFTLHPPARAQLRRAGPYVALSIVALSTLPVVIWNAQHDWISAQHVGYGNMALGEKWRPTLKYFGEFMGAEFGLMNPVFFCAAAWACFVFWRRKMEGQRRVLLTYFFSMGAPVFLICLLFTAHSRVLPNWVAPSLAPLLCLMVVYFEGRWREGLQMVQPWLTVGVVLGGFVFVLLHDTNMTNKIFGRTLPVPLDPLRRVWAWSATADAVEAARKKLEAEGKPAFIIGGHYSMVGMCSFYIPEARAAVKTKPLAYHRTMDSPENQFYYWPGYRQVRKGENAIYVHELDTARLAKGWFGKWIHGDEGLYGKPKLESLEPPPELVKEFESVKRIGVTDIEYRGRVLRRVEMYACRNLR